MRKLFTVLSLLILVIVIYFLVIILAPGPSLDHTLAKLKSHGIPTSANEVIPYELSDSENGAMVYKQAFTIYDSFIKNHKDDFAEALLDRNKYLDEPASKKGQYVDTILNNPDLNKVYGLLEKAAAMKCQFIKRNDLMKGASKKIDYEYNNLYFFNRISKLLSVKSRIEADSKNYDDSFATDLLMLKIANSLENEPILLSQLVRMALCGKGIESLQNTVFSSTGNIDALQDIITCLTHTNNKNSAKSGFMGEPVWVVNSEPYAMTMLQDLGWSIPEMLIRMNSKKYFRAIQIGILSSCIEMIPVFNMPYYKGQKILTEAKNKNKRPSIVTAIFYPYDVLTSYFSSVSRYGTFYTQEEILSAYIDVATLGIANRMYKEKNGKFVDSLDQLAPVIMSSIPKDPFSGKDYVYRRDDNGFIIYSLGENMKDDNGKFVKLGKEDPDIAWRDPGN